MKQLVVFSLDSVGDLVSRYLELCVAPLCSQRDHALALSARVYEIQYPLNVIEKELGSFSLKTSCQIHLTLESLYRRTPKRLSTMCTSTRRKRQ